MLGRRYAGDWWKFRVQADKILTLWFSSTQGRPRDYELWLGNDWGIWRYCGGQDDVWWIFWRTWWCRGEFSRKEGGLGRCIFPLGPEGTGVSIISDAFPQSLLLLVIRREGVFLLRLADFTESRRVPGVIVFIWGLIEGAWRIEVAGVLLVEFIGGEFYKG